MVLAVVVAYRILAAALVVRVIAGWFGYFRYTRWIRPAYALTDWLVEAIRPVLPIAGGVGWSPPAPPLGLRSGEGRGGEEGRSRWAPDHLKKKKTRKAGSGRRQLTVRAIVRRSTTGTALPSSIENQHSFGH